MPTDIDPAFAAFLDGPNPLRNGDGHALARESEQRM
jgi:hypothetical protein